MHCQCGYVQDAHAGATVVQMAHDTQQPLSTLNWTTIKRAQALLCGDVPDKHVRAYSKKAQHRVEHARRYVQSNQQQCFAQQFKEPHLAPGSEVGV